MNRKDFLKSLLVIPLIPVIPLSQDSKFTHSMEWEGGCNPSQPISEAVKDAEQGMRELPFSRFDDPRNLKDSEFKIDPNGKWEDFDNASGQKEFQIVFYLFNVKLTKSAYDKIQIAFN